MKKGKVPDQESNNANEKPPLKFFIERNSIYGEILLKYRAASEDVKQKVDDIQNRRGQRIRIHK